MTHLALLAAGLVFGLSPAAPPPAPEVAVLVVDLAGGPAAAGEALLDRVAPADGSGWLRRAEPVFTQADFAGCAATGVDPEPCVRETLAARDAARLEGPPTVVVLIRPAPGFHVGWTCIGVGGAPTNEARQRSPDIRSSPGVESANAQAAAGCILAAAAESGW
jgi:hypothetical protein